MSDKKDPNRGQFINKRCSSPPQEIIYEYSDQADKENHQNSNIKEEGQENFEKSSEKKMNQFIIGILILNYIFIQKILVSKVITTLLR